MSSPKKASINDNICRQHTHVAYSSVDDAAHLMQHFGTNALLASKETYRIIPIHSDDWPFLGHHWKRQVYINCQLPFGLASATAIFSAVGEALEWVLRQRGAQAVIHYLDDFLLVWSSGTDDCQRALSITLIMLGVSLAADKTTQIASEPPSSCNQSFSAGKCTVCHQSPDGARADSPCQRGGPYRAGMVGLANCNWTGTSVHQFLLLRQPNHHMYTDASGTWGCDAWSLPHWLQIQWSTKTSLPSIALKELFPVVIATAVWGPFWTGKLILCH